MIQRAHRRRRVFAILFGGLTLIFTLIPAFFDYVVDPYAVFNTSAIPGFNVLKPRPDVMIGDIKFIVGARYRPTALILGNSRADVGFNPNHAVFAAHHLRAYNAAVPGSGPDYSAEAFRRFSAVTTVRSAIVGIDFLDYLFSPRDTAEVSPASAEPASSIRTRLLSLFSTTAFLDSIKTVRIQRQSDPAIIEPNGFNPMLDYREIAASEGYAALFRQRAQESARTLANQPHNLYVGGARRSPSFSALRSLLRAARETGTELKLVIYPYHLLVLLQYEEAGLWPLFEQWKNDVVQITDEARHHGTHVSLWDFSCPSTLTTEAVPPEGDRRSSMKRYWEGGHFKKELGDLVLERIFGMEKLEPVDGFGFELTPENVDSTNATCRTALAMMKGKFPSLARQAADLAQSTRLPN